MLKKNTYYSLSATEDAYGKAEREIQLKWSSDRDWEWVSEREREREIGRHKEWTERERVKEELQI